MIRIRHNHPDLKGSFTCLGNWYNVLNEDSMEKCHTLLKRVSPTDLKTAKKEIAQAKKALNEWQPDPTLNFLYREYEKQNKC